MWRRAASPRPVSVAELGGPPAGTKLASLADLESREALVLTFGQGREAREVFLMARQGEVVAYLNDCPHRHLPLNFHPEKFLDPAGTRLLCTNHLALFRIGDGFCEEGPCRGHFLTPVTLRIEGDAILAG